MHRAPPWFYPLSLHDALPISKSIHCDICAGLFSAADRCFPRARLQPPRETHSAGSSDTCYSRRSQRSSAPNNHVSEGNTRGLLRESEDDETPQRASFASEEAHREPAESVVYFRSGMCYFAIYRCCVKNNKSFRWDEYLRASPVPIFKKRSLSFIKSIIDSLKFLVKK